MKYLVLAVAIALAGCATTEFKTYEAKNNAFEGKGGTKSLVDGMEMWSNGDPPRRFKILGVIEDERGGGVIPMAQLKGDIVKKAKESGGDAVIELSSSSQIAGVYSNAYATPTGTGVTAAGMAMPLRKQTSRFAVVKYLD